MVCDVEGNGSFTFSHEQELFLGPSFLCSLSMLIGFVLSGVFSSSMDTKASL